jgi:hypothetical protein
MRLQVIQGVHAPEVCAATNSEGVVFKKRAEIINQFFSEARTYKFLS